MKFSARGGGLAEGHQPIEKYFIVLAFQMPSGARGARRAGRSANRSLPVELIGYSENNVPYCGSLEGWTLAESTIFFFLFGVFKKGPLGGTGRIRVLAHSPKGREKNNQSQWTELG